MIFNRPEHGQPQHRYTLLEQHSPVNQHFSRPSLPLLTRMRLAIRTTPFVVQCIAGLSFILLVVTVFPISNHLPAIHKHLKSSVNFIHPPGFRGRLSLASQPTTPLVPSPLNASLASPPSSIEKASRASPSPPKEQASPASPSPPIKHKRPPVSRPVVPHALRPLPPPPPSSPELCNRCGCSADNQVQRTFDAPDELVLHRSPDQTISPGSSDPSSSIVTHIWSSIRDMYCQHPLLSSEAALALLDRSQPGSPVLAQTIRAEVDTLEAGLPTQYIFTKTSAFARTRALRADYFRRHAKTINDHRAQVAARGGRYLPESEMKWGTGRRQLVWIVVEDGEKIAEDVEAVLVQSALPFIYFAYGPTRRYGNAQQNAAYALIHRLSTSVLGHGPIVSIDDDGKVLSELYDIVWRVRRFGVWPMGNLGPTGWEGPEYDPETEEFIYWHRAPEDQRPFPLDNGSFAFSSEVFGTHFRLVGPRYWPTDYPGGESEFVSQILSRQDMVEPLCYNCHVAWHNQRLTDDCLAHRPACTEF